MTANIVVAITNRRTVQTRNEFVVVERRIGAAPRITKYMKCFASKRKSFQFNVFSLLIQSPVEIL